MASLENWLLKFFIDADCPLWARQNLPAKHCVSIFDLTSIKTPQVLPSSSLPHVTAGLNWSQHGSKYLWQLSWTYQSMCCLWRLLWILAGQNTVTTVKNVYFSTLHVYLLKEYYRLSTNGTNLSKVMNYTCTKGSVFGIRFGNVHFPMAINVHSQKWLAQRAENLLVGRNLSL